MDQESADIDAWRRVHRQLTLALLQSRDNIAAELTKRRYLLEEMNRCKMQNTQKSTPGSSGGSKAKKKATPKKVVPKKGPAVAAKVKKVPSHPAVTSAKSAPTKATPNPKAATKMKPKKSGAISKEAKVASKVKQLPAAATPVATKPKLPQKAAGMASKATGGSIAQHPATKTQPTTASGMGASGVSNQNNFTQEGNEAITLQQNQHQFAELAQQQINPMLLAQQYASMYGNLGMGLATPQQMSLAVQLMMNQNNNLGFGAEDDDSDEEDTTTF